MSDITREKAMELAEHYFGPHAHLAAGIIHKYANAVRADFAGELLGMDVEPVGWIDEFGNVYPLAARRGPSWVNEHQRDWKPLYTHPIPSRQEERKPLTRKEMCDLVAMASGAPAAEEYLDDCVAPLVRAYEKCLRDGTRPVDPVNIKEQGK